MNRNGPGLLHEVRYSDCGWRYFVAEVRHTDVGHRPSAFTPGLWDVGAYVRMADGSIRRHHRMFKIDTEWDLDQAKNVIMDETFS